MIHRNRITPPSYIYPTDEWRNVEKRFHPQLMGLMESVFSISNGYLGLRGNFDEGRPCVENGVFVNGFHETWPIIYGEEAYGFAKTGQTMLNLPDARRIRLFVDDEPLFLPTASLLDFERALDMQRGLLYRNLLWETPAGILVEVKSTRMVSFKHRHIAMVTYAVTLRNERAPVVISSEIAPPPDPATSDDPRHASAIDRSCLEQKFHDHHDNRIYLGFRTQSSRMSLACGMDHEITADSTLDTDVSIGNQSAKMVFSCDARPGSTISLVKYISYHSSRQSSPEELCERADRSLKRARKQGHDKLIAEQRRYLDDFWEQSDIQVESRPDVAKVTTGEFLQALRFNIYQVFQASARAEGVGIPAKGLTGQAYEGHYFWDSEIYVLPFLTYTNPRIARNQLIFRHSMLELARNRAKKLSQKGCLFPWRTINGHEASAYYAAGTAQYHINADIMYAVERYATATGDKEFLYTYGAEMLVETARMWADLGFYSEEKNGAFCIVGVTGPDEYTTVVDNNLFTNLMARENLSYAVKVVREMRNEAPGAYAALLDKTGLEQNEPDAWERAAKAMYVPYDETRGIHLQDEDFLHKKPWDLDALPSEKFPLLLHYHPLVIYRHQVIKQADMVLAMFLLGKEFSPEQKKRNFAFYDKLTTGDSSLSVGIQSIIAAEIDESPIAAAYAYYATLMDLGDVSGNAQDGLHIASMGATWMVMVYGFAGMRDDDGHISFNPKPLAGMQQMRFKLQIRGCVLEVALTREQALYTLRQGEHLSFRHKGERLELTQEAPTAVASI